MPDWVGRTAVLVLAGGLLAACAAAPPPPPPPPPPAASGASCFDRLARMGVPFETVAEFREGPGCGIDAPVRVGGALVAWNRPATLTCALAERLAAFEARVIQPAAIAHFGKPVRRVHHVGTYSCRRRNDARGGRLSEHAFGRAIDVTAFELADGTIVNLQRDWRGAGPKSAFLHAVSRSACGMFSVVLTPNHDRAHRDHLHLDIGPHRLCGY